MITNLINESLIIIWVEQKRECAMKNGYIREQAVGKNYKNQVNEINKRQKMLKCQTFIHTKISYYEDATTSSLMYSAILSVMPHVFHSLS